MQDRKDRAVASGIEELVTMPTGGERAGFRLAITDNGSGDKIGVVEDGAERMRQRIAEFSTFVD